MYLKVQQFIKIFLVTGTDCQKAKLLFSYPEVLDSTKHMADFWSICTFSDFFLQNIFIDDFSILNILIFSSSCKTAGTDALSMSVVISSQNSFPKKLWKCDHSQ